MRRLLLCLLVAGIGTLGFARGAAAYPQFQFSSGTNKCSQCHFAPAGGGLISSWGRERGGRHDQHGGRRRRSCTAPVELPSWFARAPTCAWRRRAPRTGGDESPQVAWFPMQADLYARFAFGEAFSLYLEGGVRGEARPADDSVPGRFDGIGDRFISREHYLMWRPSATGPYARIGRFFAPYGLRFVEHIFFIRRYTGSELYNETYTASGGYVADEWELHLSAFTPPPTGFPDALQSVGARESGGAAYFEYRMNGMSALAAQARVGIGKRGEPLPGRPGRQAVARAREAAVPGRGRLHHPEHHRRVATRRTSSFRTSGSRTSRSAA